MIICPICENSNAKLIKLSLFADFFYCEVCQGHFVKEKVEIQYPEEYFQEKSNPSFVSRFVRPVLNLFTKLRVKTIKSAVGKGNAKILDYGCGCGGLVEALIKRGFNAVGFEPSSGARVIAERKNLPVYGEVKTIGGGYDLIMFWHSLEHTPDPLAVIIKAKEYLNENGKLLIAVPNAGSFETRIFKENWFHYDYPFHLIHFTPKSVQIMLQKSGFYPVSIDFWNPEYTISGLIQSFLNWFLPKDALYSVICHRRWSWPLSEAAFWVGASLILSVVFSPALILFFLVELIFNKTGAIIIIAERAKNI